jgi:hypothetical protein
MAVAGVETEAGAFTTLRRQALEQSTVGQENGMYEPGVQAILMGLAADSLRQARR